MSEHRLAIHCFPSSDGAFRRAAESLLDQAEHPDDPSDGARVAFEARLRMAYPEARVRGREPLAGYGPEHVWYAYRDSGQHPRAPWRVLVVEDHQAMARLIAAAVASEGAEVRTAANGKAALEVTETWEPDAIVLDLSMPELDGPGFAAEYRRRRGEVHIIVVSAALDAFVTSEQIGAHGCLSKPFDLDRLIELVWPTAPTVEVSQS